MNGSTQNGAVPMLGWMSSLADATRARTLRLVERHELTVADLCAILQAPQSTVSRHLRILSDDGWLSVRPEGTSRLYRLAARDLDPAAKKLWALLREQTASSTAAEQDDHRLTEVLRERRRRSQAFFQNAAGHWDRMREEMFGGRFDLQATLSLLPPDAKVADLGCGTGQLSALLSPFVGTVTAVESSTEMLGAARDRLGDLENVEIRPGELEAVPLGDAEFDIATMGLVLHHIPDPAEVLAEAARILRPGGRLLVIDMLPHDRVDYQSQMGHVWLGFAPEKIAGWLQEAGFHQERIRALPAEPQAKGPALFAATATRVAVAHPHGETTQDGLSRKETGGIQ